MKKTVFEQLEVTATKYPDKVIFFDSTREITYKDFVQECKYVGTELIKNNWLNKPIAIYIDKTINCLKNMIGI